MALPTPMLSLLALATLLSVPAPGAAQQQTTNVTTGTSLQAAAGAGWPSPSGRFAFGFYATDGGLAVGVWLATTPNITVTWTANRNDTPSTGGALWLTYDGRLVWTGPADGQDRNLAVPSRPAAAAAMGSSTCTSSAMDPKRSGLRRATKRATFQDATVTVKTKGRQDRAFKHTGGEVRQKARIFETWLTLRAIGEEEMDGVSQRVPGSDKGTPKKTGATVVKQFWRMSSWKARPGLPARDTTALFVAAVEVSSPVCTDQSRWGVAGLGDEAEVAEALAWGWRWGQRAAPVAARGASPPARRGRELRPWASFYLCNISLGQYNNFMGIEELLGSARKLFLINSHPYFDQINPA